VPGELAAAEGKADVSRRHRPIVTPFQIVVLILSGEPARPYFLPLGLLWGLVPISLPPWRPDESSWRPTEVLIRAPYRRHFWSAMHRAMTLSDVAGSCSFSIALGLS